MSIDIESSIIEHLEDPAHIIDSDLRLIFFNHAFKKWNEEIGLISNPLGMRIDEAFNFLTEEIIEEYKEIFRSKIQKISEETTTIGNKTFYTRTQRIPIILENEVKFIVTIVRNITPSKRTQKALLESERKYEFLMNNLPEIIIELDKDGVFTYVSPQSSRLTGFLPDEMVGKSSFEFIHPEDLDALRKIITNALKGKRFIEFHLRALHKDNSYIPILATGNLVEINGEIKFVGFLTDISDHIRVQQELMRSEARYRMLLKKLEDGVLLEDKDGYFSFVNPSAGKILGYSEDELIGMRWSQLVSTDDYETMKEEVSKWLEDHSSTYETKVKRKDGRFVPVLIKATPIFKEKNDIEEFNGVLVVLTDITDRTQARKERARLAKRQRELWIKQHTSFELP